MALSRTNPLYVPPLLSGGDFIAEFEPPDYLIDGLLQRGFLYSMTGQTGTGKTAVALRLAYSLASGVPFGRHPVLSTGAVLYLAGENHTDIQLRWATMQRQFGFAYANTPVYFMPGTWKIDKGWPTMVQTIKKAGLEFSLIVIDTMAAFFFGEDENDNVEAGRFAREVRMLSQDIPGKPSVLICCHPVKRGENTLPRGGGAFLNEVDGNLVCTSKRKPGSEESIIPVTLSWAGKWRGPDFEKIPLKLEGVDGALPDSRGRVLPSVVADCLSDAEAEALEAGDDGSEDLASPEDEEAVRGVLSPTVGQGTFTIAKTLGWTYGAEATPNHNRVKRALLSMEKRGLVRRIGKRANRWLLATE